MVPIRSAFLAIIASLVAVSLSAQQDTTHAHAAPTAPLLTGNRLVTELRADDEAATLLVPVGGQTTSRVDDVDVERIATIAILPGPAATALYGTDAANGVLLITTKRGVHGRSRLRAFSSQGV